MIDLASGAGGVNVDVTSLVQYGVLGIFAILLLLARIVPWSIYDEKKKEIERLQGLVDAKDAQLIAERDRHDAEMSALREAKDSEIRTLQSGYNDKVFPLLLRVTDLLDRRPRAR